MFQHTYFKLKDSFYKNFKRLVKIFSKISDFNLEIWLFNYTALNQLLETNKCTD